MLSRYNFIVIHQALQQSQATPLFPPINDRDRWETAQTQLGDMKVASFIQNAEQDALREIPFLRATQYLEFKNTGERQGYENPVLQRRTMLSNMTIAECFENKGRFLNPLLDIAWAICEESSWATPAHQRNLTDIKKPTLDLVATMTATHLAEFDLLLGDSLDLLLRKRIHDEIDQRILTPFLSHYDWYWWMYNTSEKSVNNWNAVVNGCVIRSALLIEKDNHRLAEIIARAARSLDDYLATFDADGGSTEGPSYWSYGFGHYVMAADALYHRTDGTINFFAEDIVKQAAVFPAKTILSHNLFVPFSDCAIHASLDGSLLSYLGKHFNYPNLLALANQQPPNSIRVKSSLSLNLRSIFWNTETNIPQQFVPNKHDWYHDMQWMLSRQDPRDPNALVLAIKGGHNDEMHNQNDVGSLVIHVNGESVIADLGRGRYTKAYFSDTERYQHFVCQSLGHSTPVPNGYQQGTGRDFAASVIDYEQSDLLDRIRLELKDVYPEETDLESLVREVSFHRNTAQGYIELHDKVTFAKTEGHLETALITLGTSKLSQDQVILLGKKGKLVVEYDTQFVEVRIETIKDVDLAEGLVTVNRIVFAMKSLAKTGHIHLKIYPYDNQSNLL